MKSIRWLLEAEEELAEAVAYYDSRSQSAARLFLLRVAEAVAEIRHFPESGRLISRRARRRLVSRFPYGLLYLIKPDEIVIVGVMHLHRKPGYWEDRV